MRSRSPTPPTPAPARRYRPGRYRGQEVLVRVDEGVDIGQFIRHSADGGDVAVDPREVTLIELAPLPPRVMRRKPTTWTREREVVLWRVVGDNPGMIRADLARKLVDALDGQVDYKQTYGRLMQLGLPKTDTDVVLTGHGARGEPGTPSRMGHETPSQDDVDSSPPVEKQTD